MYVIRKRNAHRALPYGLRHLNEVGQPEGSRDGDVIVAPGPVATVYDCPVERVVFWPERDANPFFHLFESLWMLAGRNDLALPQCFVKSFDRFSDDGVTLHGAYGHRWRNWPGDQLDRIVDLMSGHSRTRRAVLTMWDPDRDLFPEQGKDVPCNTTIYFSESYGRANERNRLDMMVCCRSNDIVMGLYGANAVHFSMLMEYMAARLDLEVGTMTTISNNFHSYARDYNRIRTGALALWGPIWDDCPYAREEVKPFPLVDDPSSWDQELLFMLSAAEAKSEDRIRTGAIWKNSFFPRVVLPMYLAHEAWRAGDWLRAGYYTREIAASDWQLAVAQWLLRRAAKAGMTSIPELVGIW
jgi:hypothetical protein